MRRTDAGFVLRSTDKSVTRTSCAALGRHLRDARLASADGKAPANSRQEKVDDTGEGC